VIYLVQFHFRRVRDKLVLAQMLNEYGMKQRRRHHSSPSPLGILPKIKDGGYGVLPFIAKVAYSEEVRKSD
jgi:hypothetical protein